MRGAFVVFFLLALFLVPNTVFALTNVTSCGTLSTDNEFYQLNQSVSNSGTCFIVQAHNSTIDCDGFTIDYSTGATGYAFQIDSYNNITVKNCNITQGSSSSSSYAVYLYNSTGGNILDNNITTSGSNGYGLYLNQHSDRINISGNNVTTSGQDGHGVYAHISYNCTISDNIVFTDGNNAYGLYLDNSHNCTSSWNNVTTQDSGGRAVYLIGSDNNIMENNNFTSFGSSAYGIYLFSGSDNNNLTGNSIKTHGNSAYGIRLYGSTKTTLKGNEINATEAKGIEFPESETGSHYDHDIDESNTVNSKPVRLYYNQSDIVIEDNQSYGMIVVAYSDNVTIRNLTMTLDGIYLFLVNSSTVTNIAMNISAYSGRGVSVYRGWENNVSYNNITNTGSNGEGMHVSYCDNCTIADNQIKTTYSHGVYFYSSQRANVSGNNVTVSGTSSRGYYLTGSDNNNLTGNNATFQGGSSSGFYISGSDNNTLEDNRVDGHGGSGYGIRIVSNSFNNTARNSVIEIHSDAGSSTPGIEIDGCDNNTITTNHITTNCGSCYGINIKTNSENNTASDNNITTLAGSAAYGIFVMGDENILEGNNIETFGSQGYGIYITSDTDDNSIISNNITIHYSNTYGVYVYTNCDRTEIRENVINSTGYAIRVYTTSHNTTIFNNTLISAGSYGIQVSDCYYSNISRNEINSTGFGVGCWDCHNSTMEWNRINSNTGGGLMVQSTNGMNIAHNDINCEDDGISISNHCSNANVSRNNVSSSASYEYGLLFADSWDSYFSNNRINTSGTEGYGIYCDNCSDSAFENNIINTTGSNARGAYVRENSQNNNFTGNNISVGNSNAYPFYISSSMKTTLRNNSLNSSYSFPIFIDGGFDPSNYDHDIDGSNRENGKTLKYYFNISDTILEDLSLGHVMIAASDNVTIRNLTISGYGLDLLLTTNSKILENSINTSNNGIYLRSNSSGNNISFNNITSTGANGKGVYFNGMLCKKNTLDNNIITASGSSSYSVYLYNTSNNTISGNTLNTTGSGGHAIDISTDTNNITIFGNSINSSQSSGIYMSSGASKNINITKNSILAGGACIYVSSPDNMTVSNNDMTSANKYCLYFYNSDYNNVTGNNITSYEEGIYAQTIKYSNISDNVINSSNDPCIYLFSSSKGNTVSGNTLNAENDHGIYFFSSENNSITGNFINVTGNDYDGIRFSTASNSNVTNNTINVTRGNGVYLLSTSRWNLISGNNVTVWEEYYDCIYLSSSDNNNITGNRLVSRNETISRAFYISGSYYNYIYDNFINTSYENVYVSGTTNPNYWNIAKTQRKNILGGNWTGGNFYARFNGLGFSENCTNDPDDDGICNDIYQHAVNNIDDLPLIAFNPSPSVTLVSPGNNNITDNSTVIFNCSATDDSGLANMTLYGNWSGGWHSNETADITGKDNYTTFIKVLPEGMFIWNCRAFDDKSKPRFSSQNYTITVDTTNPVSSFGTNPPENRSAQNGNVSFEIKCSDNMDADTLELWSDWSGSWSPNQTK